MRITVDHRKGDELNKNVIKQAVEFFSNKLIKKCLLKKIESIKVTIVRNFKNLGECYSEVKDGKYSYFIRINKDLPFHEIISTLAHEMIHVEQFISGNLVSENDDFWIWKGTEYNINVYKTLHFMEEQSSLPWEKIAYENEHKLARKFFNHILK